MFSIPKARLAAISAHTIGVLSIILGFYLVHIGKVEAVYLWFTFFGYFFLGFCSTIILHRYYSHRAFSTGKIGKWIIGYLSILPVQGSSMTWAAMHTGHHIYSDKPKDPHITHYSYIWKKSFNVDMEVMTKCVRIVLRKMDKEDLRVMFFTFKNYFSILFGTVAILALISPTFLLYGYLMPLGLVWSVASLHQVTSHQKLRPVDMPFMEFIIPAGGEWYHLNHHKYPKSARFGKYDLGYLVILLLAKKGSVNAKDF